MMTGMTSPPIPQQELLTVPEAAAELRLAPGTLYRWSCTGIHPELFVRVGGGVQRRRLRVDAVRLAQHIAAGTRDPA
jgi:hypothetical protein